MLMTTEQASNFYDVAVIARQQGGAVRSETEGKYKAAAFHSGVIQVVNPLGQFENYKSIHHFATAYGLQTKDNALAVKTSSIRTLLDEIDALEADIQGGAQAWSDGEDSFAMAACDPSDQYVKGEQISELWKQVVQLAKQCVN